MAILETHDLTKVYSTNSETITALDEINLSVDAGEFISVVGPSGSGKTTLLNMLGLLDDPTDGHILLKGTDVTALSEREKTDARRKTIGFVFQQFHLVPTLTARENVSMPKLFYSTGTDERAADLLRQVELGDRLEHKPNELSGGQKQRVAIARSLINDPQIVLADEPTGNLDRDTSRQILKVFNRVCEMGVAVVAVTHDELVEDYVDRTVDLVDGTL